MEHAILVHARLSEVHLNFKCLHCNDEEDGEEVVMEEEAKI